MEANHNIMGLTDRLKGFFKIRIRKDFNFRRLLETAPALRWLKPRNGERILDIGCGDGTYNYRIAQRGAHIVGLDMNRYQLGRAITHHKTTGTGFLCADATYIPVRTGEFDTVMSLCVFEHLPNDKETLREAWRILRPHGRLLLTLDSLSNDALDDEWRSVHRERHFVRQFYTHETISELLEQCGFSLERHKYLVSSPHDFLLMKLSYAAERMNPVLAMVVRLSLVTGGRVLSAFWNLFAPVDRGWTLLIEARKQS